MAVRKSGGRTDDYMKRIGFLLVAFFVFSSLSLSTASAQVPIRMRIIQASNVGQSIDPSLNDVHRELGSLFNFTSYRLLREENLRLSPNQPVMITAHPGRFMEVTLVELKREAAKLKIRVIREEKDILDTQVRLSPGRTILIGGPRHGEGVVIYALSARF
jgi:hypothetical protein